MDQYWGVFATGVKVTATERFVELVDESTLKDIGGWRRSWSGYVLLKQLARDRTGFPDELLEAIELSTLRRLKINVLREGHRRGVQVRNGPLLPVMYSLIPGAIALTVSMMTVAHSAATLGLLAIMVTLAIAVTSLMILGVATWWIPGYLSLLDALDDSVNRRPARLSWLRRKATAQR